MTPQPNAEVNGAPEGHHVEHHTAPSSRSNAITVGQGSRRRARVSLTDTADRAESERAQCAPKRRTSPSAAPAHRRASPFDPTSRPGPASHRTETPRLRSPGTSSRRCATPSVERVGRCASTDRARRGGAPVSAGSRSIPSSGALASGRAPARASSVAVQSIVIAVWSVVLSGVITPGQRANAGVRSAALVQRHLAVAEWTHLGETLAAIVTAEDHERIALVTGLSVVQRGSSDALIHALHHARVDRRRPTRR